MTRWGDPAADEARPSRTACAADDLSFLLAARVMTVVASGRFNLTTEKLTQAEIEFALLDMFDPAAISREHRLGPGEIPDFLIARCVVLEIKGARHRAPAVLRQLERYARHDCVAVILVATARAMFLPSAIGGKPCRTINLGRAWL